MLQAAGHMSKRQDSRISSPAKYHQALQYIEGMAGGGRKPRSMRIHPMCRRYDDHQMMSPFSDEESVSCPWRAGILSRYWPECAKSSWKESF
jgi:hypothetical protein